MNVADGQKLKRLRYSGTQKRRLIKGGVSLFVFDRPRPYQALASASTGSIFAICIDVKRGSIAINNFCIDDNFDNAFQRRQFEHGIKENAFHDGTKSPCARFPV